MSAPAGYAALYPGEPRLPEPMCFGWAETLEGCKAVAQRQLQVPDNQMGCRIYSDLVWQPLDADQASEVAEMLDAPWLMLEGV